MAVPRNNALFHLRLHLKTIVNLLLKSSILVYPGGRGNGSFLLKKCCLVSLCKCPGVPQGQPRGMAADKCRISLREHTQVHMFKLVSPKLSFMARKRHVVSFAGGMRESIQWNLSRKGKSNNKYHDTSKLAQSQSRVLPFPSVNKTYMQYSFVPRPVKHWSNLPQPLFHETFKKGDCLEHEELFNWPFDCV